MKDFVSFLAKNIVEQPEKILVEEEEVDGQLFLSLQVAKEDMGRVIGKGGKIVKALRNLVRIRAIKEGKKASLKLIEKE